MSEFGFHRKPHEEEISPTMGHSTGQEAFQITGRRISVPDPGRALCSSVNFSNVTVVVLEESHVFEDGHVTCVVYVRACVCCLLCLPAHAVAAEVPAEHS